VRDQSRRHRFARAELFFADEHGDVASIFGQENRFLGCAVAASYHDQGLLAENGHGAITDGAGGDAVLPVFFLA